MHDNRRGNTADDDEVILETLHKQLEAFGTGKYGKKIYASESYQDCLQKVMFRLWQKRLTETLPSEGDLYRYSCKAVDNCIRDAWRRAKRTDLLLVGEVELIPASASAASGPADLQRELEMVGEAKGIKSLFLGNTRMHDYIEHLAMGTKRKTIASEMKLTPRQVTDLHRKLKRKVKR